MTDQPRIVALPPKPPAPPLGSIERGILLAAEQAACEGFDDTATDLGPVVPLAQLRSILERSSDLRGATR